MEAQDRKVLDEEGVLGPQTEKGPAEPPREEADTVGAAELGVNEKHMVRKLDMFLIPLVMALYLFSFLDR